MTRFPESLESFGLELVAATNAEIDEGADDFVGFIDPSDGGPINVFPLLFVAPATGAGHEGESLYTSVFVSEPNHGGVTVTFEVETDGVENPATWGQDYASGLSVFIPDGESNASLPITLNPDSENEGDENFAIKISSVQGGFGFDYGNDRFNGSIIDVYPNASPIFTSTQIREAFVGQEYQYVSRATDPNGDSLNFLVRYCGLSRGI